MHQSDLPIGPDIRGRLSGARLPVMPQMLLELMERCQSDEFSMAEVAELIAKDAAMTAKILGVANSSAYRRAGQPGNLEQSLLALGTEMVRMLLISESVFQMFNNSSPSNSFDLRGFWQHSLATAVTARLIAKKIGYPHIEEAYFAGLLHDVGRLVLLATVPEEYASIFLAGDDENLCAIEQRTLSITHAEAGACLIERWNLDSFLADSVLYHHEAVARLEKAHALIRIVFLAHQLSGHGQDDAQLEAAGSVCGITLDDMALIRCQADEQVKKTAGLLGIDLEGYGELQPAAALAPTAAMPNPAKERLAENVHNSALAAEARRTFAGVPEERQLAETVIRSACTVFGFADAAILLPDAKGQTLTGAAADMHGRRIAELSIALNGGGAIAEAALQRRLAYIGHKDNPLGVVEEQLLRILGTECLVCLPLVAENHCHGILIGGASSRQLAGFGARERLLRAFGAEVAAAYKAIRNEQAEVSRGLANAQEQYRDASRRVAHEVNNPLTIIKNYLSVLDRKLARREPVAGEMAILNEEIDRVARIINGLGEPQPTSQEGVTDVNQIVADVVRLFGNTEYAPASVRLVSRVQDKPLETSGDADTLKQILVNLIKNAVEALPEGGEIAIANNGLINRDGRLYIELGVKDTGPGIAPEVMAKLFSPVQSTKGSGHRGLGLAIVHSLVKKLDGIITCRSDKTGTAFEILLPGFTERAAASRSQSKNYA
jgi:putative nucleotidyltransferase with HDIG domain